MRRAGDGSARRRRVAEGIEGPESVSRTVWEPEVAFGVAVPEPGAARSCVLCGCDMVVGVIAVARVVQRCGITRMS